MKYCVTTSECTHISLHVCTFSHTIVYTDSRGFDAPYHVCLHPSDDTRKNYSSIPFDFLTPKISTKIS